MTKYGTVALFACAFTIAMLPALSSALADARIRADARACDAGQPDAAVKIDCWLQVIYGEMRAGGLDGAFRAFDHVYETYPVFGATGCHTHAHKVGDAAYYRYFIAENVPLESLVFPQSATACGYGFFHGFIEHYVQAKPDADTVTQLCEYLDPLYSGNMRDISLVCYHAGGHGFTQAELDTLAQEEWGDVRRLVERPLSLCERLPEATPEEIEECMEGVFNVINEWTAAEDYGLRFDLDDPFRECRQMEPAYRYACYYEYAQNVLPVVGHSPVAAEKFVSDIADDSLKEMSYSVIVAGMMQEKAPLNEHGALFRECSAVRDDALFKFCVISLVNGMMEHGDPGDEYEKILDSCASDAPADRDGKGLCYRTLAERLSRFYDAEKKARICALMPAEHRAHCAASR